MPKIKTFRDLSHRQQHERSLLTQENNDKSSFRIKYLTKEGASIHTNKHSTPRKSREMNPDMLDANQAQVNIEFCRRHHRAQKEHLTLQQRLYNWAIEYNVSQESLTTLLYILRKEGHDELPSDAKTLLNTSQRHPKIAIAICEYGSGHLFHYDPENIKNDRKEKKEMLNVNVIDRISNINDVNDIGDEINNDNDINDEDVVEVNNDNIKKEILHVDVNDSVGNIDDDDEINDGNDANDDDIEVNNINDGIAPNKCYKCCEACRTEQRKMFQQIDAKLDFIIQMIQNKEATNNMTVENCDTNLLPEFPLITIEEFFKFEEELRRDEEIRKQFKNKIAKIGGKSYSNKIRSILKLIINDNVAKKLSWTGQKQSIAIKNTIFAHIITSYIGSTEECNLYEIQKVIQEWLRRAGDRLNYHLLKK